ncbi:hypothetical protein [Legionella oakridgensis]|uniref:OmpA-like transmembrane domain protein n=2 Tax=Legionella oakridgensis TaxID=29423 RepID=W0BFU9_9GAMM|nr:hypothetical protein [Legionella oakridgensis]AHE67576.1 hypothetical protein Loa_02032 [Legionella oakridgensis ATCC 33761 = DSM 21215]ETO92820.1 hypothetical protein LOR_61c14740 [Legionella oakridgensis RV-2-2007]KTD37074.1 OmpA-like transmembrane domain-containing protein [Legionella oakridgensis]STY20617.1 OmpA-like transmembrane domain protein [Legionella longbeachae]
MRKTVLPMFFMGVLAQGAYAGGMGGGSSVGTGSLVPFISGEGAVTWNTVKSATVFGSGPSISKQLWGGRGAVGLAYGYSNHFGFTSEAGWGYYGSTNSHVSGSIPSGRLSIANSSYLYGFDLLAGITYDFVPFSVYLKGGAMAENRHVKGTAIFENSIGSSNYTSTNRLTTVSTNIHPEIKVGGLYNFTDHLDFTLAYMHVFGNNDFSSTVTGAFASPQATAGIYSVANAQAPSLDSVMFGLIYNFG